MYLLDPDTIVPGEGDGDDDGLGLGPPLLEEGDEEQDEREFPVLRVKRERETASALGPQRPYHPHQHPHTSHQHITGPGLPPPPPPRLPSTNEAQRRARVPPLEVHAIKALSARTNVLPVLARADTLGEARLREVKRAVRRDLAEVGIGFGIFDVEGEGDGVDGGFGGEGEGVPWERERERAEIEMRANEGRETGEESLGVKGEWDVPAPGMDVEPILMSSAHPQLQLHTLKITKSPGTPTSTTASVPAIVTSTSSGPATTATTTTQAAPPAPVSAPGLPTPTSAAGVSKSGAGGGAHRWSTSSSITAVTASSPTSPMYANPPPTQQRGWKTHAKAAVNMNLTPRELLLQSAQMHRPRAGTVYLGGEGRVHHDAHAHFVAPDSYPYPVDAEAEAVNVNDGQAQVPPPRKPLRIPVPALPHAVAAPDAYAHGEGVPARWIPFSSSTANPSSSAYLAELVKRYTAPGEHLSKLAGEAAGARDQDRDRDREECEREPGAYTETDALGPHPRTPTPAWIREARLGKFTRQFRWGALDILNAAHCDFVPLRRAVFDCMTVRSLLSFLFFSFLFFSLMIFFGFCFGILGSSR